MLKKLALPFAVLVLAACATPEPPPVPRTLSQTPPSVAWGRVLQYYVDDRGRVDFAGLSGNRADLDRIVSHVYAYSPRNQPSLHPTKAHVKAYHLNAYNALAMYQVLEAGAPTSIGGLGNYRFFSREVRVGGEPTSLGEYKDKVIRKLGDPRVHFAISDMTLSAPRLSRKPYKAELLDQQLDIETRYFFIEHRNVKVDEEARTVYLSPILERYQDDFLTQAPSLVAYVNKYRAAPIPSDYKVKFFPHDWTVSQKK